MRVMLGSSVPFDLFLLAAAFIVVLAGFLAAAAE
jgi:hypothetical protein